MPVEYVVQVEGIALRDESPALFETRFRSIAAAERHYLGACNSKRTSKVSLLRFDPRNKEVQVIRVFSPLPLASTASRVSPPEGWFKPQALPKPMPKLSPAGPRAWELYFGLRAAHAILCFDPVLGYKQQRDPPDGGEVFDLIVHEAGRNIANSIIYQAALQVREVATVSPSRRLALDIVKDRLEVVATILNAKGYDWRGRYKATAHLESAIAAWAMVL
jgi:hypothetical protein